MPYKLRLTVVLNKAGWRVSIYDAEGAEEPHVSIFRRKQSWRISLRSGELLDGASWRDIDASVKGLIELHWERLKIEWNAIHRTNNPI
jgi:hypothetical protein